MIRNQNYIIIFLSLLLMLFLVGCSDFMEGKDAADKAVAEFHTLFNQEKFQSIYEKSHKKFKKEIKEEEFVQLLEAIHRKLGKVTNRTNTSWSVNTHDMTTDVTLQQETTYENGKGTETFLYIIEDSKAFLLSYDIDSTDLIIK